MENINKISTVQVLSIPSFCQKFIEGEVQFLSIENFRSIFELSHFIPENARLCISWVSLKNEEKLEVHTHPIDSFYIIAQGEGILLGNGKDVLLKAGDIVMIPKGCEHGFIGAGKSGYWGLSIQFEEQGLYEAIDIPLVSFKEL